MSINVVHQSRLRYIPWRLRHTLLRHVDRVHGFRGAGVHVSLSGLRQCLRPSNGAIDVIMELRTAPPPPEPWQTEDFWWEVFDAGISCSATAVCGVAAASSAAAAPLTVGTSAWVAGIATAGTIATGMQCTNSLYRVSNELFRPGVNESLDANPYYSWGSKALDVVSIAGGVSTLFRAGRAASRVARNGSRAWYRFNEPLHRAARKRLVKELNMRAAGLTSAKQYKRLLHSGEFSKTIPQSRITAATRKHLLNSLAAGLSMFGSGSRGVLRDAVVEVVVFVVEQSVDSAPRKVTERPKAFLESAK